MSFDRYFIDDVRRATDAVTEIGRYVELKKSGSRWRGLCPFHQEKTPSFYVDQSLGLYKCFGCGKGGDLIGFIMEMESLSFPEAVEMLARKAGIAIPESKKTPSGPRRAEIEDVLQATVDFYHRTLHNTASGAREYLDGREFGEDIWKRWKLGWAPGKSSLYNYLKDKYAKKLLLSAGVVRDSDKGGDPYDFFRDRLVIPLHNPTGRIVGLSGRALGDGHPKYVNSSESSHFQKSRLMYAFHLARREAGKREEWLVVEGYFDCIRLHEAGFTHAVATMGTALTVQHGEMMKRVAPRVLLCFDGDEAGQKAAEGSTGILLEAGMDIDIIFIPDGLDPDDFIARNGADAMAALLAEGRRSFFDFIWEREFPEGVRRLQPLEKRQKIQRILDTLKKMKDEMLRFEYLNRLSSRVDIPVAMLVKSIARPLSAQRPEEEFQHLPEDMERSLLGILLQSKKLQVEYRKRLHSGLFTGEDTHFIAVLLAELLDKNREGVDISDFRSHLIERGGEPGLLSNVIIMERGSDLIDRYFCHLEEKYYSRELKEVQKSLEQAKGEEVEDLLTRKQEISSLLIEARNKRGREPF